MHLVGPMQNQPTTHNLHISVWSPDRQGSGSFDGGKITEIKPIPFPQERGGSDRIGPLFYWAWASARGDGVIGMHPHQGFEIISYVMEGSVGHTDTAGNNRRVYAGGIQAMQTGSGISHQEEMHGERTEFLQIWFEPDMRAALGQRPRYLDFEGSQIPREELSDGVVAKHIVGPNGALRIQAPAVWDEIWIPEGVKYTIPIGNGEVVAFLITEGAVVVEANGEQSRLEECHFATAQSAASSNLTLVSDGPVKLTTIKVPQDPGYSLINL